MQKMLRLLLPCLVITMFLSSCGFYERRQKIKLCTEILATNDTLDKMTKTWHGLLQRGIQVKSLAGLRIYRTEMGAFVSRRRSINADLDLVPSATPLRDSEEAFLSARADIIANVYAPFEEFTDYSPPMALRNQLRLVLNDLYAEQSATGAIKRSVDAMIARNGLRLKK